MEKKKTDNWSHWFKKTRSSKYGKSYFTVGDVKQMFNIWQNQKKSLLLEIKNLKKENNQLNEFVDELNFVEHEQQI